MLKSIALKTLIAGGVIAAAATMTTGTANAGNLNVQITPNLGLDIHYKGNRHRHNHGHHRRPQGQYYGDYYQPYYPQPQYNHRPNRHFCSPRKAVKRAWKRHGLQNPYVHRVGERRIVVRGWQWGYQTKLVYDRYSNCRVIKKVHFNR